MPYAVMVDDDDDDDVRVWDYDIKTIGVNGTSIYLSVCMYVWDGG